MRLSPESFLEGEQRLLMALDSRTARVDSSPQASRSPSKTRWLRQWCVRYASKMCLCQQSVTEESVRDSVLELAGIEEEDLLYFSHSNIALSHLPYMVAIDRCAQSFRSAPLLSQRLLCVDMSFYVTSAQRMVFTSLSTSNTDHGAASAACDRVASLGCRKTKTVVVAIRGTMSLADLVTDAVVHPEPLTSWLPTATRKVGPIVGASPLANTIRIKRTLHRTVQAGRGVSVLPFACR